MNNFGFARKKPRVGIQLEQCSGQAIVTEQESWPKHMGRRDDRFNSRLKIGKHSSSRSIYQQPSLSCHASTQGNAAIKSNSLPAPKDTRSLKKLAYNLFNDRRIKIQSKPKILHAANKFRLREAFAHSSKASIPTGVTEGSSLLKTFKKENTVAYHIVSSPSWMKTKDCLSFEKTRSHVKQTLKNCFKQRRKTYLEVKMTADLLRPDIKWKSQ